MTLTKTIARYGRVDLLCIDELGYMALDKRGAELLSSRYSPNARKKPPWASPVTRRSAAGPRPSPDPSALRRHRRSPHLRRQHPRNRHRFYRLAHTPAATATAPTSDVSIHEHNKAVGDHGDVRIHEQPTSGLTTKAIRSSLKTCTCRADSGRRLRPPLDRRSPGKGSVMCRSSSELAAPPVFGMPVAYQDAAIVARLERSECRASRIFNDSPDAIRVGLRVAGQKNPRGGEQSSTFAISQSIQAARSSASPSSNWTASGHSGSPCATCNLVDALRYPPG